MGFKALKAYITKTLGLPLPKIPNRGNCVKLVLEHQNGETQPKQKPTVNLYYVLCVVYTYSSINSLNQ